MPSPVNSNRPIRKKDIRKNQVKSQPDIYAQDLTTFKKVPYSPISWMFVGIALAQKPARHTNNGESCQIYQINCIVCTERKRDVYYKPQQYLF